MDILIQGILLGSLYALFALGLSLMFGVMRLTNTAHGDFIILGAFGALGAMACGLSPWLSALLVLPMAWLVGYGLSVDWWSTNGLANCGADQGGLSVWSVGQMDQG